MTVHDDYYKNYGIENMEIDKMSIGIGYDNEHISLKDVPLEGWNKVEYHERLKQSYYILKEYWTGGNS